ncbi:MAG: alpha/beta hydrolase [Caulobacteraceae bacterium]
MRIRTDLFALAAVIAAAAMPANAEYVSKPVSPTAALGTGPYKAIMEADPRLPTHTLYRPANLPAVRGKMPIVVWGEGGCANEGNRFRWFLSEISSYGYLILAVGPIAKPEMEIWKPDAPQPAPGGPPLQLPPPKTHSVQLIEAMNWAIAENKRAGSRFFGRLDPAKIAVMGMSCGGAQTIEVSADPRIVTSVMFNSGLFADPTTMGGGKTLTKDDLKLIHAPIAYISGDESDVAFGNANDDFERINHVPIFRGYRRKTGHGGTYGEPNGGAFGKVGVAWLNWRLKGDKAASRMFVGPRCGLCTDAQWVVKRKGIR